MKDTFNYIIANFKNDAEFRIFVLIIALSLLIPVIYTIHKKRRGKSVRGLPYIISVCIGLCLASFMFIRNPIKHAGEYWDTVLCEYVVAPPFIAYNTLDEKTMMAAYSIREWYMELPENTRGTKICDMVGEKLAENGFADIIEDDSLFTDRVATYLYWQRWLNDMDEYLDRRYAEVGVTRTEKWADKNQK